MSKERILYWIAGTLMVLYIMVDYYSPKPIDWTITFGEKDKRPFGCYILYDQLDNFFPEKKIDYQTLYEVNDLKGSLFILSDAFEIVKTDIDNLFNILNDGNTVLIGSRSFGRQILDTLEIEVDNKYPVFSNILEDSSSITYDGKTIEYPRTLVTTTFINLDKSGWDMHATSGPDPILISKKFGSGRLILLSAPLIFSNYGLLHNDNYAFADFILNMLPNKPVTYNRFYQSGRIEHRSPFRFLISQPSLRSATYLTLFGIIVLLVFNSQRKQKAIPVYDRPSNTTIHYIKTIGGLYYREKDHHKAAMKIIYQFLQVVSEKYHVKDPFEERSWHMIAAKSNLEREEVHEILRYLKMVKMSSYLSEDDLKEVYQKIKKLNII